MALPININKLLNGHTVEWDRIELKKGWNPKNIIHSLCAYANDINNLDGGYIIVGVEEVNGKAKLPPIGLIPEQIDSIQKKLVEIYNKISPTYIAIEEAVVNAVYHKSYERDNPVEIQILPDRIEILSFPGPLPPIDNDMLQRERVVARDYRNRKIGDFLKELKLTEGRGTGIPIIHSELEKNGSPPLLLETNKERTYFLCTIRIHPLVRHIDVPENTSTTKDETKDNTLEINSLKDVDFYLRSLNDLRWDKENTTIKSKVNNQFLKILKYCTNSKTREEIFSYIGIYNNSRNFKNYIKPIIDLDWLQQTIPEKPTSKNQKYLTSEIAKKLVKIETTGIHRTPVASSNIASVGFDANNKILEIEFHHGAIYQYFNVPEKLYKELTKSPSLGSYFMHNIKNNFDYQKV